MVLRYNINLSANLEFVVIVLYVYFIRRIVGIMLITDFFRDTFRQLIRPQVQTRPMFLIGFLYTGQQMSPVVRDDLRDTGTAFRAV